MGSLRQVVQTFSFLASAVLLGVAAFLFLAGADFLADFALAGGAGFFAGGAFLFASGFLDEADVDEDCAFASFLGLFFSRSSRFRLRSNSLSWSSSL